MGRYSKYEFIDLVYISFIFVAVWTGTDLLVDYFTSLPEQLKQTLSARRNIGRAGIEFASLGYSEATDWWGIFRKAWVAVGFALAIWHLAVGRWTAVGRAIGIALLRFAYALSSIRENKNVIQIQVREEPDYLPIIILLAIAVVCGAA